MSKEIVSYIIINKSAGVPCYYTLLKKQISEKYTIAIQVVWQKFIFH